MYQNFNPDAADWYDESTKFERFIICLSMLSWRWIIHPRKCYQTFICGEVILGEESLKRKKNKLYYEGILNETKN